MKPDSGKLAPLRSRPSMKVIDRVMSPSSASAIRSYISRKWACLLSGSPKGTSADGSFTELSIAMRMRRSSSRMLST